jgi:hypothetical protein
MEASYEGGQGPEGAVVPYMDGCSEIYGNITIPCIKGLRRICKVRSEDVMLRHKVEVQ